MAYDVQLARARAALGGLLSAGGRPGKKARRTRAAMAALEGGRRGATRRERWFGEGVNAGWVGGTAGEGWREAGEWEVGMRGEVRRDGNGDGDGGGERVTDEDEDEEM